LQSICIKSVLASNQYEYIGVVTDSDPFFLSHRRMNMQWASCGGSMSDFFSTNKSKCVIVRSSILVVFQLFISCNWFIVPCDGLEQLLLESPPRLDGRHLVFTVAEASSFLEFSTAQEDGSTSYSGYLIDMLQALARPDRANFTYELRPPSGLGVDCVPGIGVSSNNGTLTVADAGAALYYYDSAYWRQYNCATNDVELSSNSTYKTDAFLGLFYASLDRLRKFQLTIPFNPPYEGTPAMFGTKTGLATIEAVVERQQRDANLHVCMPTSTATYNMVRSVYPDLRITELIGVDDLRATLEDGTCSILLIDSPVGQSMIRHFAEQGKCLVKGKVRCDRPLPRHVIGAPMILASLTLLSLPSPSVSLVNQCSLGYLIMLLASAGNNPRKFRVYFRTG
jgi:hypothetical protein